MRLSGALFLVVLAAGARAAEPAAAAGDSISTAKQDLAAIKAPAGQEPGAVLPTLDMKDIGPLPGAALPEMPSLRTPEKESALEAAKKKQGTGNWLVDAMDKKQDGARPQKGHEKEDDRKAEDDLLRGDDRAVTPGEKDTLPGDEARERSAAKEEAGPVYNPLDSFMSGWISAKDRDLLVAGARAEGPAGGEAAHGRAELLPGMDTGQAASLVDNLIGPADTGNFAESRSGANPYLLPGDLSAPAAKWLLAPEGQAPGAPGVSDFSRGMSTSGVDPRPLDASRTFIPDFAQPVDDDKYFKQMKRF